MSDNVTLEEARNCPKCGKPGREHIKQKAANGDGTVYTFICMTELCPWNDSGWTVQVKANGEIPTRDTGNMGKQFQAYTDTQKAMAQRMIDDAKRADQ